MKHVKVWLILAAIGCVGIVSGQEDDTTHWNNAVKFGINLSQASFSNNWKGGGNSSFSFGALFLGKWNYLKAP